MVQTPYGDSGKTTFFIRGQRDWDRHADKLVDGELKIMKRINNYEVCLEASLTSCGTVVGPFMTSLIGYPELTPYKGGWCGNDIFPDALPPAQRARARDLTEKLGARLAQEGYRGFFEVDFLVDRDTGELYLGELNPRLSGISSMTNVTAGAYADMPLFLFHLLEYMDVPYEIDVGRHQPPLGADRRRRRLEPAHHQGDPSGGRAADRGAEDRRLASSTTAGADLVRALGQRLAQPDRRDRGVLPERRHAAASTATRAPTSASWSRAGGCRPTTTSSTERCRQWVDAIKAQFAGTPVAPDEPAGRTTPFAFKKS